MERILNMSTKNIIISRLSQDLFGPDDQESKEILPAYPTDTYLTGILFPQNSKIAQEDMDQLQSEGVSDIDSNDVSKDEISLVNSKRPSSMGLSFVVESTEKFPNISLQISAGIYEAIQNNTHEIQSEKKEWARKPVKFSLDDIVINYSSRDYDESKTGIEGLSLHIRASKWDNKILITVALMNINTPDAEYEREQYEEKSFFQTHIKVTPAKNTRLCPRPVRGMAVDEDTKTASLIYRNVVDYAVGHTCSAIWPESDGDMPYVETAWIPLTTVKAMNADGIKEFSHLTEKETGPVLSTFGFLK